MFNDNMSNFSKHSLWSALLSGNILHEEKNE